MINLSELDRQKYPLSLFARVKRRFTGLPDIYLAENIADYLEEEIHKPMYVIIHNVGINLDNSSHQDDPGWYNIHDATGQTEAYWAKEKGVLTQRTFQEVQELEGLKERDDIYEVFLHASFLKPYIIDVRKYKPSNKEKVEDKLTLKEKLTELLLEPEPLFHPG